MTSRYRFWNRTLDQNLVKLLKFRVMGVNRQTGQGVWGAADIPRPPEILGGNKSSRTPETCAASNGTVIKQKKTKKKVSNKNVFAAVPNKHVWMLLVTPASFPLPKTEAMFSQCLRNRRISTERRCATKIFSYFSQAMFQESGIAEQQHKSLLPPSQTGY